MSDARHDPVEPGPGTDRHRAPALWLVVAALVVVTVSAVVWGARTGATLLAATLLASAVARLIGRGRRPEGIAVRSTTMDVTVLLFLALAVAILAASPGV
ncbi:MAG TPA: DUF3017 domain-containing protein [Actinotalea sp.]